MYDDAIWEFRPETIGSLDFHEERVADDIILAEQAAPLVERSEPPSGVIRTVAAEAFERADAEIDMSLGCFNLDWFFSEPFALPFALDQFGFKTFFCGLKALNFDRASSASDCVLGGHIMHYKFLGALLNTVAC